MDDEEPEEIQEEIPPPQTTVTKPKRQISDAQREHLNKYEQKRQKRKQK